VRANEDIFAQPYFFANPNDKMAIMKKKYVSEPYNLEQAEFFVHSVALPRPDDLQSPWETRLALVQPTTGKVLSDNVEAWGNPQIPAPAVATSSRRSSKTNPESVAPLQGQDLAANLLALAASLEWLSRTRTIAQEKTGLRIADRVVFCPALKGVVEYCKLPQAFSSFPGLPDVASWLGEGIVTRLELEFQPLCAAPSLAGQGLVDLPLVYRPFPLLPQTGKG
jgi:hypothetical protein